MLAKPKDRLTPSQIKYILKHKALPADLPGASDSTYFRKVDPKVFFVRESNNARLVLFEGVHDMVYNAGLQWLAEQQRKSAPNP